MKRNAPLLLVTFLGLVLLMKRPVGVAIADDEFNKLYVLYHQADGSWCLVRSKY
jgi:hypothetical protein